MNKQPLFEFRRAWYLIVPAILLLGLSVLLSLVIHEHGYLFVLISITITLALSFFAFVIAFLVCQNLSKHQNTVESIDYAEKEFTKFLYNSDTALRIPGIILDEDLEKMEASITDCDEIWLISHALCSEEGLYRDTVAKNLKKGIKYVYFLPNTSGLRVEFNRKILTHLDTDCKKRISLVPLDSEFFFLVDKVDFVIYNPKRSEAYGRKAYMSLPLYGCDCTYEAPMNNDLVDIIISKLTKYIESAN